MSPGRALFSVLFAAFTLGYMLPWMIAASRGNSNQWKVFWINVFLGWTVVGWVWALVLSMRPHRVVSTTRAPWAGNYG